MARLVDVVASPCKLLLVGINPSLRSAELGHHFASPGNPFWRLLHAARIVNEPLTSERDRELTRYGISLTNLCPRPTRAAAELTLEEMAAGARTLRRKCTRWRPRLVAFVGISLYQFVFELPKSGGPGLKLQTLAGARVYVVPNPSGLNASFPGFAHKLVWYEGLREALEEEGG